jgi:amino acid transporter
MSDEPNGLGSGQLTTIDCIAQSLAVGPIFSAAAVGSVVAALSGGVGSFVIVLVTVGFLGLGWTISEFAKRYSGAGTLYEYVAHSLGKRPAVLTSGLYILAIGGLVAAAAIYFGISAHAFFDAHLSISPPWWVWALTFIAITYVVNILGVQISVRTQLTVLLLSLVPFAVVSLIMIVNGGAGGSRSLASFNPSNSQGSIFKGILFAIGMFVGVELAAALGEETANPKHSIPRAVMTSILAVAGFYVLTQWVGQVGFAKVDDWAAGGYGALADGRGHHWLAVLIELAVLLDLLAVGIGMTIAVARGLFTLARDGMLPKPLAATNRQHIPAVATTVVSGTIALAILVALTIYGTGALLASDNSVVFPEKAFQAFLVAGTLGGFLVCICYALVALGALAKFATKRPIDLIAALVGLATCVLGIAAQFVEGTAPTGDAKWGIWLGLLAIGACVVWITDFLLHAVPAVGPVRGLVVTDTRGAVSISRAGAFHLG